MTLPGVSVSTRDEAAPAVLDFDTGAAFVVGVLDRGPTDEPFVARSLASYVAKAGPRSSASQAVYDWLDVAYREGLGTAYVLRVAADDAEAATVNLPHTGSGDPVALAATAASVGDWANTLLKVTVADGTAPGSYTLTVEYDGETVESSPDLADNDEAIAWAESSEYLSVTKQGADNPDAGTYTLTGGDDGAAVTDDDLVDALDVLTKDRGPGQVVIPAKTSDAIHIGLLEHARTHNRVALLDLQDLSSASGLVAEVTAVRSQGGARFGAAFAPWAVVPGVAAGTTRTVPYSAVEAGLIARLDAATENPNQAAAGANGVSRYAQGLSQPAWSDDDRETLNDGGVNVARVFRGEIRTYGYRTLVNPVADPRWVEFSGSREVMAILAEAEQIAEAFEFAQLDGRGITVADFAGDLTAVCAAHYSRGALYGTTAEDAFNVDVSVNTAETAAERRLLATLLLRTSPFAERVEVELVKRLTTETV